MKGKEVLEFSIRSFWGLPVCSREKSKVEVKQTEDTLVTLKEGDRELISPAIDEYRPFLATVLNEQVLVVLGDFEGNDEDEIRMFQFDVSMANKVKEFWELLREVRFTASLGPLEASERLQNPEAFFGRVDDKLVIVLSGDTTNDRQNELFAYVEAPELLCRLGRPESEH